jgi:hypothetical protein
MAMKRLKKPRLGQTYIWGGMSWGGAELAMHTIVSFEKCNANVWIFKGLNHRTQNLVTMNFTRIPGAVMWELVK